MAVLKFISFCLCFGTLFCISLHWLFTIIKYLYEQEHIAMLQYLNQCDIYLFCILCLRFCGNLVSRPSAEIY